MVDFKLLRRSSLEKFCHQAQRQNKYSSVFSVYLIHTCVFFFFLSRNIDLLAFVQYAFLLLKITVVHAHYSIIFLIVSRRSIGAAELLDQIKYRVRWED